MISTYKLNNATEILDEVINHPNNLEPYYVMDEAIAFLEELNPYGSDIEKAIDMEKKIKASIAYLKGYTKYLDELDKWGWDAMEVLKDVLITLNSEYEQSLEITDTNCYDIAINQRTLGEQLAVGHLSVFDLLIFKKFAKEIESNINDVTGMEDVTAVYNRLIDVLTSLSETVNKYTSYEEDLPLFDALNEVGTDILILNARYGTDKD